MTPIKKPTWITWAAIAGTITLIGVVLGALNDAFDLRDRVIIDSTPSLIPITSKTIVFQPSPILPTFTPFLSTPTTTYTPSPFPSETSVPAAFPFTTILENCPDISKRLGTQKTFEPFPDPYVAYQEFEGVGLKKGVMIYRANAEKDSAIAALFPDGTWKTYPDLWLQGMPEYSTEQTPPDGYYRPVHGFEFAWLDIQNSEPSGLRLNWATMCEISGDSVAWRFNEGRIFQLVSFRHFTYFDPASSCSEKDSIDRIGTTYVLFYSPGNSENTGNWLDITYCRNPQ